MRHLLITLLVILIGLPLVAQTKGMVIQKGEDGQDIKITLNDQEMIKELDGKKVMINFSGKVSDGGDSPESPYFGIYVDDISFPKAQTLNYDKNFGVIITGVVKDSPAWQFRLLEDDIIQSINGEKVLNNAIFNKIRSGLRAGDKISLDIFRSGKTTNVEMVVGSRNKNISISTETSAKKKLSPGFGGGTWVPVWFTPDLTEVNGLLSDMGFSPQPEDGMLAHGLMGKGHVGKGWFIGGIGVGHEDTQKKAIVIGGVPVGTQWLRYTAGFGGVTLDKRIPITQNFISSAGIMLGAGGHNLEVTKSDGNYTWDNLDNAYFINYNLSKSYFVVQPKAELMYRFLSWLAIRGEVGYVYGYAPNDRWQISGFSGDTFDVPDSPKTKYEGLTFSVGPWFGF